MRLIDADALKRLVDEEWFDCPSKESFFDEIDRTPTIDPVKQGVWLKYPGTVVSDDGLWGETLFDCSECGHTVHVATRFCSKCGARMNEPDKPKQISAEFAKLMREGEIQVRWKRREG